MHAGRARCSSVSRLADGAIFAPRPVRFPPEFRVVLPPSAGATEAASSGDVGDVGNSAAGNGDNGDNGPVDASRWPIRGPQWASTGGYRRRRASSCFEKKVERA